MKKISTQEELSVTEESFDVVQIAKDYPKEKSKKSKIPTEQENPEGLHHRYNITKVNGDPIDENAEYFILRLDKGGDDIKHIQACRKAVRVYAKKIKKHLPILSKDILKRYKKIK